MKNFQQYFYESNKIYEFRVKIANCDVTKTEMMDRIKNAVDQYCIETISAPKRLPIQEHREFHTLGPCECYVIDIGVKYPTVSEQIRNLIVTRAMIESCCVCVMTKDQCEQLDAIQERIDGQDPVLETPELESNTEGQALVGEKRISSFMKELQTRKFEIAGTDKDTTGKTTNDLPQSNIAPVGSTKNKIYNPRTGK